jgi:hypothetical protein
MFQQEWMNVSGATGFAFEIEGLLVLERRDCIGIREFGNN